MNVTFNELVSIDDKSREFEFKPFKRFDSFAGLFSFEELLFL